MPRRATTRRCGSARSSRRTSSSTTTRARRHRRCACRSSRKPCTPTSSGAGPRAGGPHARGAGGSGRRSERLDDARPLQPDRAHGRAAHAAPRRLGTRATGCGWCSRTSTPMCCISISRAGGRASRGASSAGPPSRFRTSRCRCGRSRASRRSRRAGRRGPRRARATSTPSSARRRARTVRAARSRRRRTRGLAVRHGWYAYGAFFHEYLARRFGEAKLAELSRRTAGRLPYFGAGAFKAVYGASLGSLWRDFARRRGWLIGQPPSARRLTRHGYLVDGPRFDRDGTVVYTRRDAHEFPSLARVALTGTAPRRLATRYGGTQVASSRDAIYFDQLEVHANVALASDVYRLDRPRERSGDLRGAPGSPTSTSRPMAGGLRRFARAAARGRWSSSIAPARRRSHRRGRRCRCRRTDAGVVFASPRWSPDGRRLAAERRLRDGPSEIVDCRWRRTP